MAWNAAAHEAWEERELDAYLGKGGTRPPTLNRAKQEGFAAMLQRVNEENAARHRESINRAKARKEGMVFQ